MPNTLSKMIFAGCTAIAFFYWHPVVKADLLYNGDFEIPGSNGLDTFHSGKSPNEPTDPRSGADGWFVWHNFDGTTETNSRTYSEAGIAPIFGWQDSNTDRLLRVEASNAGNGLVQTWSLPNTGPLAATGSVWVYVPNVGQKVGVGIGNGGSTSITVESSGTGAGWEKLEFTQSNSPVNEINIYATTSGAEFYVDFATVSAVPEPAAAGALGLAMIGLLLRRRPRLRHCR